MILPRGTWSHRFSLPLALGPLRILNTGHSEGSNSAYTLTSKSNHLDKDVLLQLREIQQRDYDLIILNEDGNADVTDLIQASYDLHFGSLISSDDNSGVEGWEEADEEGVAAAAG